MTIAANLGYPRIGPRRELKAALESFWAGKTPEAELRATAAGLRTASRRLQQGAGIGHIPGGDFTLYDHVLDTACALGAIPPGHGWKGEGPVSLETYFSLARGGRSEGCCAGHASSALEMTKWFDTNYHYLVPELDRRPALRARPPTACSPSRAGRPGPRLPPGRCCSARSPSCCCRKRPTAAPPLDLLPRLLPVYAEALRGLAGPAPTWVQFDEPCLVTDLTAGAPRPTGRAYAALARGCAAGRDLLLATYFGAAARQPAAGLRPAGGRAALDLVRAPASSRPRWPAPAASKWLVARRGRRPQHLAHRPRRALGRWLEHARRRCAATELMVAPSCSLLHVPVDLAQETALDPELRRWLAFADEKLDECASLARALDEGEAARRRRG